MKCITNLKKNVEIFTQKKKIPFICIIDDKIIEVVLHFCLQKGG